MYTTERRLQLDEKFRTLLGTTNAYFQPPASVKIKYPCIVYRLGRPDVRHADNRIYRNMRRYDGLYIHRDPDDFFIERLMEEFPYFEFDRRYVADNLYHDSFTLYY